MFGRLTLVAGVLVLVLSLGGCSKCGFWLDEWMNRQQPGSCKGDWPK